MNDKDLEVLRLMGIIGLDMSPGDPVCKAAYEEIIRLREHWTKHREACGNPTAENHTV